MPNIVDNKASNVSADSREDIIEDVLVDSELAKKIVPNKFKFTSKQGRTRRHQLLMGAKTLSETHPVSEISLADVCEEAGIPRASAYHFFPNVEAIFLALRFLTAIELIETIDAFEVSQFNRWQGYITGLIEACMTVTTQDKSRTQLSYGPNTPDFEGEEYGNRVEIQIVQLVYGKLNEQYEMPEYENIEQVLLVTLGIIDSVFKLSYRQEHAVTDAYIQEAITAAIAYLRCYLPEKLNKR